MDKFCTKCGAALVNGVCPNCGVPQQNAAQAQQADKFKGFFMNPNERLVCVLGNGYLQNFFSNGYLRKGFAVLSDKRVYFRGKAYEPNPRHGFHTKRVSSVVDLKDVTGTEVQSISPIGLIIIGIIFAMIPFLLFFLYSLFMGLHSIFATLIATLIPYFIFLAVYVPIFRLIYKLNRKSLLLIMFGGSAGAGIAFPITWYPAEESENFQKQLRIMKDLAVENAEKSTANTIREVMAQQPAASTADELEKYARLYKEGVITEEEFAEMKAKILKQ